MISPLSSYDELLDSAHANVRLIADKAWIFDHEDSFRKLNHSLWNQCCEVTAKYEKNADYRPRLVRDVISESRLARYGNYEYDEDRERIYNPDDGKLSGRLRHFRSTEATEPWMLPEVQEHFARLISASCTRCYREPSAMTKADGARKEGEATCSNFQSNWNANSKKRHQKFSVAAGRKGSSRVEPLTVQKMNETGTIEPRANSARTFICRRYTVETVAEMQLQARIETDCVRDIWRTGDHHRAQYYEKQQPCLAARSIPSVHPNQYYQQFYYAMRYQPFVLRTDYQQRPLQLAAPVLSAEVPEFFPKERKAYQVRYLPSLDERSYRNELFPHNRSHETATPFANSRVPVFPTSETNILVRSPQEWIRAVPPPVQIQTVSCSSPRPIHEATGILHRPSQMYEKFLPCKQPSNPNATPIPVYQRPVELYQETMLKRKNHGVDFNNLILLTKNSVKSRYGSSRENQQPAESKQIFKSGRNMAQLFEKECTRKTKEIVTVDALVSELHSFKEKYQCGKADSGRRTAENASRRKPSENSRSKAGMFAGERSRCKTSDADERYKRTKRPLYRDVLTNTSSDCAIVPGSVFEKRYDELEQQAMEQYRNSEESLALKYQELERQAVEQYDERQTDSRSIASTDQNCFDGQRCSQQGRCNSSKRARKKKDSFSQPRITLLRPKGKSVPNVFHRSLHGDNAQSIITSRSLSTLLDKSLEESKNISKGASGDKIDTSVSICTSSKRRLILVSPFERKSEGELMQITDWRKVSSLSQARQNILDYYQASEIAKNGGGDENVTIIQPPNTKVWLSGFWTT